MSRMQCAIVASLHAKYENKFGIGLNYATKRTIFAKHASARRIRYVPGGVNGNVGLEYIRDTIAGAFAVARAGTGDWVLFPGGTTVSLTLGDPGLASGLTADPGTYPFLMGTYDPSDATNTAKDNILYCTFDWTGLATGSRMQTNTLGPGFAMQNLIFLGKPGQLISMFSQPNHATIPANRYFITDSCISDGVSWVVKAFDVGAAGTINGAAISLTSVGTTATLTNTAGLGTLGAIGDSLTDIIITGTSPSAYNGRYTITRTGTNTATFTFAGAGGVATTTGYYGVVVATIKDAGLMCDTTHRNCSFGYANGIAGAFDGNTYNNSVRRLRYEHCLLHHGGWTRTMTRSTVRYGQPGWVDPPGDGPNDKKHNAYISQNTEDVKFIDVVNSWDSANLKFTGAPYVVRDLVEIRNPMSFIFDACGNASTAQGRYVWPALAEFKLYNYTQVYCDDMYDVAIDAGGARGWGPNIYNTTSSSYVNGAVMMNQNNPSGLNRTGVVGGQNASDPSGYSPILKMANTIQATWVTQATTPPALTTYTFTDNIWDASAGGTNQNRTTLGAQAAGITAAMARDVANTFRGRYSALSGVSVGANDRETELNVLDFILYDWQNRNWHERLQREFRAPAGR